MRQQCRQAILQYADEEMQRNAALTGEHKEYVTIVLKLIREEYHAQVIAGNTEFVLPQHIVQTLESMKPYDNA